VKFIIETHIARRTADQDERFLGSPEHLRRVRHHQQALGAAAAQRASSRGPESILASVGMGPAAKAFWIGDRDGEDFITDGPFAETKEVLAGFDLLDFRSLTEAIAFAEREQVRDVDHLMVVRGLHRRWWINHYRSGTANLFMLSLFTDSPMDSDQVASTFDRAGAEYLNRHMIGDLATAWCGGVIATSGPSSALRVAKGKIEAADLTQGPGGMSMNAFVLAACESPEEARSWATKLVTRRGEVIEVRPVNGLWWIYRD
jgi:hypothetical protein